MSSTENQSELLRGLLRDSAVSLFEAHGVSMVEDQSEALHLSAEWGEHAVAVSNFEGDQIRGRLALLVPFSILEQAHPMQGLRPLDERDKRDWLCELVNQLLGQLKARLAARHVNFEQGLPSCLIGPSLERIYSAQRAGSLSVVLRGPRARAMVQVRATLSRAVDLSVEPEPIWQEGCVLWP